MKNFGVYQPPSGIENVRRSTQINSLNNLNNPKKTFDEMIEQGWGGNIPSPLLPSSSSSPSPPPSSFVPLPPGNVSASQIDAATRNCPNLCVTLVNFWGAGGGEGPSDSYGGDREGICLRPRSAWDSMTGAVVGTITSWESEYVYEIPADEAHYSLSSWFESFYNYSLGTNWDYFEVDNPTRSRCFSPPPSPSPSPSPSFGGNASPPPPPGKNMCGCDCNTIATIVEDKIAGRDKLIKDHIDQRTIEELKAINKMLQGMKIDLNLQPVIDRLNQVEANLWNGAGG
ncbi:MAG: hypothetical protein JGK17_06220 [Microcoleus sp. PH2017_10_PVI_O_A]|uniref:hypothetical protein n=1 Tax=unclassified Microcoleus TaxID=2642155 RepID=UPI001E0BA0C4|nr:MULTISPECIES: hypothetical protein [unclassified Microcoleus]TAE84471.1 MAG: hypothetical protein EAZ83_05805 [Oscillatoriales cyanobacterium]MCC3405182.1 hypothetical protein [Microcoleus sp. PH2017_10_PVI_O_A]MCC3459269.1 hypothetical protein [Microcoleus sp. PH2017_11_PCY_U_A]MCC3477416.1 hypothetical protein [Microcoleus sp. PH2017_12_PCY_D_A]MCC3558509.1 hypothetical protein [Microcoleus sp. PH2017_27_LUM_O_A]